MKNIVKEILTNYLDVKQQEFSDNDLANKLRDEYPAEIKDLIKDKYSDILVVGSPGKGKWTDVPWIAFFDSRVTETAQGGFYPVYLFCEDMSGVYLSLNQGITRLKNERKTKYARQFLLDKALEFQQQIELSNGFNVDPINLKLTNGSSSNGSFYQNGNVVSKFYSMSDLPSEQVFEQDLNYLLEQYVKLVDNYASEYASYQEYTLAYINEDVQEEEEEELLKIDQSAGLTSTEKERLIKSRLGQGIFRSELIKLSSRCAISKCNDTNLLIASHIKPWKDSDNIERLDPYNGLLLLPTYDKLFDLGYISFNEKGEILISEWISDNVDALGIDSFIKIDLDEKSKVYMKYHEKDIFKKKPTK